MAEKSDFQKAKETFQSKASGEDKSDFERMQETFEKAAEEKKVKDRRDTETSKSERDLSTTSDGDVTVSRSSASSRKSETGSAFEQNAMSSKSDFEQAKEYIQEKGREGFEQFRKQKGLDKPQTERQRAIIQRMIEQEQMEEGGLTKEEKYKAALGAQKIQDIQMKERGERAEEEISERIQDLQEKRGAEEEISERIQDLQEERERIASFEEGIKLETKEGEEITRQEALQQIKSRIGELQEGRQEALQQIESRIGELQEGRQEAQQLKERGERRAQVIEEVRGIIDVGYGKTDEAAFEDLSAGEKAVEGALTAYSPKAFELNYIALDYFMLGALPGDKGGREIVEEHFGKVRQTEQEKGRLAAIRQGAIESIGSPLGVAGLTIAGGRLYGAGLQSLTAYSASSGALAKSGTAALSATFALREAGDIKQDIEEGKYTEAGGQIIRDIFSVAGFTAGVKSVQPTVQKTSYARQGSQLQKVKGTDKAIAKPGTGQSGGVRIKRTLKYPKLTQKLGGPKSQTAITELRFSTIQSGPKSQYVAGRAYQISPKGKLVGSKEVVTSSFKSGETSLSIIKDPKAFTTITDTHLGIKKTSTKGLDLEGKTFDKLRIKTDIAGGSSRFSTSTQTFADAYQGQTGNVKVTIEGSGGASTVGKAVFTKGYTMTESGDKIVSKGRTTIYDVDPSKISKPKGSFTGQKGTFSKTTGEGGLKFTTEVKVKPQIVSNIKGMSASQIGTSGTTTAAGLSEAQQEYITATNVKELFESDVTGTEDEGKPTDYPGEGDQIVEETGTADVSEVSTSLSTVEDTQPLEDSGVVVEKTPQRTPGDRTEDIRQEKTGVGPTFESRSLEGTDVAVGQTEVVTPKEFSKQLQDTESMMKTKEWSKQLQDTESMMKTKKDTELSRRTKASQFQRSENILSLKPISGVGFKWAEQLKFDLMPKQVPKQALQQQQRTILTPTTTPTTVPTTIPKTGFGFPPAIVPSGELETGKPFFGRAPQPRDTERTEVPRLDVISASISEFRTGKATTPVSREARKKYARPETTLRGFKSVEEREGQFDFKPFNNKRKEVKFL